MRTWAWSTVELGPVGELREPLPEGALRNPREIFHYSDQDVELGFYCGHPRAILESVHAFN